MEAAIPVTDHKGDEWLIGFNRYSGGIAWWFVFEGPSFLHENGAHYDEIPLPVYTEWWS